MTAADRWSATPAQHRQDVRVALEEALDATSVDIYPGTHAALELAIQVLEEAAGEGAPT